MNYQVPPGWVKTPQARYTTEWKKGQSAKVTSGSKVSVNRMPHHILDIRLVIASGYQCPPGGSEEDNACEWEDDGGRWRW